MDKHTLARRRILQAGLALPALSALPLLATAEAKYPARPVKIILPLPAGGVVDSTVRALTSTMQPGFGQTFVIENKPGGAFLIAMNALAQSTADGYTLLHINAGMLSAQAVYKSYDVFKQLQPVAGVGETDITIAVSGKRSYKSMKELIDFGRANPGKLTYVSPGLGSLEHLALSSFCKRYGIDAVHVPVKGGPDIVKALIQGEVDFGTLAVPFIHQFAPSGGLRALVVLNEHRNPTLPDLPCLADEKLDLARLTVWGGLAAPAGTPQPVIQHLEKAVLEAMKNPELNKQFNAVGLMPRGVGTADFGKVWHSDYAWIAKAASQTPLNQ